jgi:hypothetical protein
MDASSRVNVGQSSGTIVSGLIESLAVPSQIKLFLTVAGTIFWYGRKIRNLVSFSAHPQLAVFGTFLNEVVGSNLFARGLAHLIHVARIVTEFCEKANVLVDLLGEMKEGRSEEAFSFHYVGGEVSAVRWTYIEGKRLELTDKPHPLHFIFLKIRQICERIWAILVASAQLLYVFFEVHEIFLINPLEGEVALLPLDVRALLDCFYAKGEEMCDLLEEHEEAVNHLFVSTKLPWNVKRLQSVISSGHKVAKTFEGIKRLPFKAYRAIKRNA